MGRTASALQVISTFEQFDTDSNGLISRAELKAVLQRWGNVVLTTALVQVDAVYPLVLKTVSRVHKWYQWYLLPRILLFYVS